MKATAVLVFLLCVSRTLTEDNFEKTSLKVAIKVYDECSKGEFFPCLKKKAIVMLDRLSRMEKISLTDGVAIVKADDDTQEKSNSTGDDLERNLSKEESLDELLVDKFSRLLGSRRIEISLPNILPKLEEDDSSNDINGQARGDFDISSAFGGSGGGGHGGGGGGGHGGGGGGGGGKKKKGGNQMNGLMMLIGAKLSMLGALAIGGLFLLAKKALITAKIALMLSAIIGLKKLFGNKGGGGDTKVQDVWASPSHGGGGHGGGYGGGHGGGWAPSGGGGGWDKKSFNALPYSAHKPENFD